MVNDVFKYKDDITIHIPVHFNRLIYNLENQLNIHKNSMVDITPYEVMELLDFYYSKISYNELYAPSELFKIAWYYYLTPKELLMVRRLIKKVLFYY